MALNHGTLQLNLAAQAEGTAERIRSIKNLS